jgi:hypothetical protein
MMKYCLNSGTFSKTLGSGNNGPNGGTPSFVANATLYKGLPFSDFVFSGWTTAKTCDSMSRNNNILDATYVL